MISSASVQEMHKRSGNVRSVSDITDHELLREFMNTVGKSGQLGANIRCVVSVSMLTEGWNANNVTHVLGIRASKSSAAPSAEFCGFYEIEADFAEKV